MQSENNEPKFHFPRLRHLLLSNFSLYSRQPHIEVGFEKPVFCLAGANGLGKSTFLGVLNFALTGAVPIPSRSFKSAEEYLELGLDFAKTYFDGRVLEDDRDGAEVTLEFSVGQRKYKLTRGIFEARELRFLSIEPTDSTSDYEELSPSKKQEEYGRRLAADIGVDSFSQFVFLQHFVFTFDESRHLLFWDQRALEQALYLAFGVDPQAAQMADSLRRKVDRADSRARNLNWQASDARKNLDNLQGAIRLEREASSDIENLRDFHKKLTQQRESADVRVSKLRAQISDAELLIATASARQVSLRTEYESEYLRHLKGKTDVSKHPIIDTVLTSGHCPICGSDGKQIADAIHRKLNVSECPLCETILPRRSSANTQRLSTLDKELGGVRRELDEQVKKRQRLSDELQTAERFLQEKTLELSTFEEENSKALKRLAAGSGTGVDVAITRYTDQIAELLRNKAEQIAKRDAARKELKALERRLYSQYAEAEATFAPNFRELAYMFLGLDLDIRAERSAVGLTLALQVKNEVRRDTHQLSESQRFFIDIALRMALLQYMSVAKSGALLVDTPEGSLDIAYENRAGKMFASFAKQEFGLIFTANINTSRLLLELAEECGDKLMTVCRMTSWTDLSEVQVQEEPLFEKAFASLQEALAGAGRGRRA